MKSNSTNNVNQTSSIHKLKVGDLVFYSPYFEGDGAWVMNGDLGIVLEIRSSGDYQVVCVRWIDPDLGSADMSSDVLTKIDVDKIK